MSNKRDVTVRSLSSNLLQMKFMKRSVISAQEKDDQSQYDNDGEHWVINPEICSKYRNAVEMTSNYEQCENLVYGRLSFKGFNPKVEKVMRIMSGEEEDGEEEEKETKEDKEFAAEYARVSTIAIAEKFKKKGTPFRYHKSSEKSMKRGKRNKPKSPK